MNEEELTRIAQEDSHLDLIKPRSKSVFIDGTVNADVMLKSEIDNFKSKYIESKWEERDYPGFSRIYLDKDFMNSHNNQQVSPNSNVDKGVTLIIPSLNPADTFYEMIKNIYKRWKR